MPEIRPDDVGERGLCEDEDYDTNFDAKSDRRLVD